MHDPSCSAKASLDTVVARCTGLSDFGFRVQALFGHVLLALEWKVIEINQLGHPDILASRAGRTRRVQVKTTSHGYAPWRISIERADLDGIAPRSPLERGILAVLDCAAPVSWIIVEHDEAQRHLGAPVNLETLRASSDKALSDECTEVFHEILLRHAKRLRLLKYRTLRERALSGEAL